MFLGLGCARYEVGVNAFSATGAPLQIPQASSICIVKDANAPNPILQKEIAQKIQKLLNTEGYSIETDKADYYLCFEYGIGSGRTVTGAMPIHQPGGTATANTYSSYGGSSHSTIQMPGYTTWVPYSRTVYTRWLVLKLMDGASYRSGLTTNPLWIAEVTSTGRSSDLREIINYMLVPAFDHFGENTGKRVDTVILGPDKRVKALVEQ